MLWGNILNVLKVFLYHKFIEKHLKILKQFNSTWQTETLPRLCKTPTSVFLLTQCGKKGLDFYVQIKERITIIPVSVSSMVTAILCVLKALSKQTVLFPLSAALTLPAARQCEQFNSNNWRH